MGARRIVGAAIGLVLLSTSCALTPDYERPDTETPESWRRTENTGVSFANLPWFEIYQDEALTRLIRIALEENQDLGLTLARVRESRYLVTFTRAEQFPFLDVFGSAGRGRQSREIFPGADTANNFSIGATLSFEVDLWRRFDRATEAARADLLSTEFAYRNVTISLVAEVASSYLLLRDLDSRLDISRRTAEGRRDRLEIVRARFEKGIEAEIDVNQAAVQLAIAEASVAQFEREVAQAEHALRFLLGRYPGPIERGPPNDMYVFPIDVPAGLPSELLERRPDVVEAEQRLVAETARIGVAQALRFPSLSLTGQVAAVAEDLTDLNSTDAGEWSVMAGIFQPIFNSGRLKAQKEAQVERARQANFFYQSTLRNAFREIEDALVAIETLRKEQAARARQVEAAANAARLSRARYDGGVVDYLEVLDSERTLFDAELAESAIRREALVAFVTLYKALGGGWSPEQQARLEGEDETEERRPADGEDGDEVGTEEQAPPNGEDEAEEETLPEGEDETEEQARLESETDAEATSAKNTGAPVD
jgi:multidrug efflux system outer membrane protein